MIREHNVWQIENKNIPKNVSFSFSHHHTFDMSLPALIELNIVFTNCSRSLSIMSDWTHQKFSLLIFSIQPHVITSLVNHVHEVCY